MTTDNHSSKESGNRTEQQSAVHQNRDFFIRLQDAIDAVQDAGRDDEAIRNLKDLAEDAKVPCAGGCGELVAPDLGPLTEPICETCYRENVRGQTPDDR